MGVMGFGKACGCRYMQVGKAEPKLVVACDEHADQADASPAQEVLYKALAPKDD